MSTSLKIENANEIAEAMANALGADFVKQAFDKKAGGPVLVEFKRVIETNPRKADEFWNKYQAKLEAEENSFPGTIEEAVRIRESAKGGPGTTIPMTNDASDQTPYSQFMDLLSRAEDANQVMELLNTYKPGMSDAQAESAEEAANSKFNELKGHGMPGTVVPADDSCALCGQLKKDEDEEPVEMAWDAKSMVAADFAMNHLVKVADILDGKGFNDIANLIDEALTKLAQKKKRKVL